MKPKILMILFVMLSVVFISCTQPVEKEHEALSLKVEQLCNSNIDGTVFRCESYIKLLGNAPGTATKFYFEDGREVSCPVHYQKSEECQQLGVGTNCVQICEEKGKE